MAPTKVCRTCGEEQPLDAFHRSGSRYGDGRRGTCKRCSAAAEAAKRGGPRYVLAATKTCRVCGRAKPPSAFQSPRTRRDGPGAPCLACAARLQRERNRRRYALVCAGCGAAFEAASPATRYCSRGCYTARPRTGATVACATCGREFYSERARAQRFCSPACKNAAQRKPRG